MKSWTTRAAVLALAVGGLCGGYSTVLAEEPLPLLPESDGILGVQVLFRDPIAVYLLVEVTPELAFKPATISFGDAPYSGPVVRNAVLLPGVNLIPVPNPHKSGWYTVASCGRVRTTEDETVGLN